jgi:hypothetical protein
MHPDDLVVARALRGETVRDAEAVLYEPRLPDRWLLTNGQPIRGADGGQLGAVSTVLDVTERRRSERFRDGELTVARLLNSCTALDEAAPDVVEAVGKTLGWSRVALWLADDVAGVLRPAATWNAADAPGADPDRRPIGRGDSHPIAHAWRSGEPVWNTAGTTASTAVVAAPGARRFLAVPVRTAYAVRGVLACLSPDNARHTAIPGTGLGLVLVQTLVQAHGGTVALDPEHRPGSRFVVRLPRCQ